MLTMPLKTFRDGTAAGGGNRKILGYGALRADNGAEKGKGGTGRNGAAL
jgi:hypothetical protein